MLTIAGLAFVITIKVLNAFFFVFMDSCMLGAIITVVKLDLDLQQTSQLLGEFPTVYRVKW